MKAEGNFTHGKLMQAEYRISFFCNFSKKVNEEWSKNTPNETTKKFEIPFCVNIS